MFSDGADDIACHIHRLLRHKKDYIYWRLEAVLDISVIIPFHDEEKSLEHLYARLSSSLNKEKYGYELIFVDDGSDDAGFASIKRISEGDPHTRVIRLNRNSGKAAALDKGISAAHGAHLLFIDADLQCDPADLLRIRKELDRYDAVLGYRINRRESDGLLKHLSSRVANALRNLVLNENFKDAGCPLRGFHRQCLDGLNASFSYEYLIFSLFQAKGFRIGEIPIKIMPRKFGNSHFGIGNRLFATCALLFKAVRVKSDISAHRLKNANAS